MTRNDKNTFIRPLFKRLARGGLKAAGTASGILPALLTTPETASLSLGAAVVAILTPLIDEGIFGTLEDEAAHSDKEKIHKALAQIKDKLDEGDLDLANLIVGQSVHYDLSRRTFQKLNQIANLIKDPDNAPVPDYLENALRTIIEKTDDQTTRITDKVDERFDDLSQGITYNTRLLRRLIETLQPSPHHDRKQLLHNLPYTSIGAIFTGRDDVLKKLKSRLRAKKPTAITQTLQGLGGIGKTRLAVEFAWWAINNKKYRAVFFLNAESPETLDASLAKLTAPSLLNLPQGRRRA